MPERIFAIGIDGVAYLESAWFAERVSSLQLRIPSIPA